MMGPKLKHYNDENELVKLLLLINLDDGMDVPSNWQHSCENLNFQICNSYASSRGSQSSLTG